MNIDNTHLSTLWHKIVTQSDQKAFEELFTGCYTRLVKFAAEYLQSTEAAEEVVSDVFMKLWTGRQQFEAVAHIGKYLFTAVRNQSLNHLRQFSNIHIVSTDDAGEARLVNTFDPCSATEWRELLLRLDEAVEQLSPRRRMIFRLIKDEGFKPKEVAEILQLSHRTVETQLFQAVKQLHVILAPYLSDYRQKTPATDILSIAGLLAILLPGMAS
ncbi:RNA polymerase sigma-70 factor [Chitinophaga horti]|uniref:RNA polymerase sigma-70 factor n=1 Tax=Chitinophaga horti TaxID=2920382 RepID=A0ABY6IYZ4_9BACT|nr:RNA polymerase sigma-70 factor [Chitinophaga horti]UYQ92500.1 RNA polymerase sigma-70 factor [Chitinophaga horti]